MVNGYNHLPVYKVRWKLVEVKRRFILRPENRVTDTLRAGVGNRRAICVTDAFTRFIKPAVGKYIRCTHIKRLSIGVANKLMFRWDVFCVVHFPELKTAWENFRTNLLTEGRLDLFTRGGVNDVVPGQVQGLPIFLS